jgi:hypothetical protein
MNLSNDTMEGKLVAGIIDRLSKQDSLDETAIMNIQDAVNFLERLYDGLSFCLSEEDDLLSQWRGYAADATGLSIGFSSEYIMSLSKRSRDQAKPHFSLHKVEYDATAQEELIRPTYKEVKKIIDSGKLKFPQPINMLYQRTDEEI